MHVLKTLGEIVNYELEKQTIDGQFHQVVYELLQLKPLFQILNQMGSHLEPPHHIHPKTNGKRLPKDVSKSKSQRPDLTLQTNISKQQPRMLKS